MLIVLEHLPHEGAGLLGRLAGQLGIPTRVVRLHLGEPVPSQIDAGDALVVLGGDMNTDQGDDFPHLHDERALLRAALAAQRPVLGICLGAQLLAEAAGGRVHHAALTCAYVPLEPVGDAAGDPLLRVLPRDVRVLNLNGDQIELGGAGRLLAGSPGVPTQAFRVGPRAYGVQFHPEFDVPALRRLLEEPSIEPYLRAGGLTGAELLAQAEALEEPSRTAAESLLRAWLALATAGGGTGRDAVG